MEFIGAEGHNKIFLNYIKMMGKHKLIHSTFSVILRIQSNQIGQSPIQLKVQRQQQLGRERTRRSPRS